MTVVFAAADLNYCLEMVQISKVLESTTIAHWKGRVLLCGSELLYSTVAPFAAITKKYLEATGLQWISQQVDPGQSLLVAVSQCHQVTQIISARLFAGSDS